MSTDAATESGAPQEREPLTLDGFFWFYLLLGSAFTSFAIISIVLKTFDVGVAPVMQEVLDYYRSWVHPPMEWLLGWVKMWLPHLDLPKWAADVYAVSFVGGAALGRAAAMNYRASGLTRTIITVAIGGLAGASLLGLVVILAVVLQALTIICAATLEWLLNPLLWLLRRPSVTLVNDANDDVAFFWSTLLFVSAIAADGSSSLGKWLLVSSMLLMMFVVPWHLWSLVHRQQKVTLMDRLQVVLPLSAFGAVLFFAVNSQL